MDEKHREIAEDLFSRISMSLTEIGSIVPIFILILEDNQLFPVLVEESVDFREYSDIAIDIAANCGAIAMMLISEQYMVNIKSDEDIISSFINGQIKPSEHPDKEEYLCLFYIDGLANCESLISQIHRDIAGTPFTRDSKWVDHSTTSIMRSWK